MGSSEEEPTGLPIELTKYVSGLLGIDIFIETGTGLGRTTNIAGLLFKRVYTIEAHEARWQLARERFEDRENIMCLYGQSPDALGDVLETVGHSPSIVFLDAHCDYRDPVTDDVCPLLAEIKVVRESNQDHVIIIDDEHAFTSVPYNLEYRDHWPELIQVTDTLRLWGQGQTPYIFIEGKCIVSVPRGIKQDIDGWLHKAKYDELRI